MGTSGACASGAVTSSLGSCSCPRGECPVAGCAGRVSRHAQMSLLWSLCPPGLLRPRTTALTCAPCPPRRRPPWPAGTAPAPWPWPCRPCSTMFLQGQGGGRRPSCRARGWRLWPPAHSFYLLLPEGLKSASHSHPASRALSQSHALLISGGKPSTPSGCHHCISSLNGPALGLSNLLHIPHPPAQPICAARKGRISLSSSHSPARMAVCCLQDEVQTHCLGHLKPALPHPSYIPLLQSTSSEAILEAGSSPSHLGLLPRPPLALSPSSGCPSLLLWHL